MKVGQRSCCESGSRQNMSLRLYSSAAFEKKLCGKKGGSTGKAQDKLIIQVSAEVHIRSSASLGCSDRGQGYPTLECLVPSGSVSASNQLWHFMNIHEYWLSAFRISLSLRSASTSPCAPLPPDTPHKSSWIRMQSLHFSKILHLILLLSYLSLPKVLIFIRLFLTISGGNVTMSLMEMSDGVLYLSCTWAL